MDRLRIATYNIHRCIGADGRTDAGRIASVIRELNAHVVALQEVAFDPRQPRNLLFDLARRMGADVVPGATLLEPGGQYGNAILTRHAPLRVKRLDLSVPGREPRGALAIGFAFGDLTVRVVATHLGLRPYERCRQTQRLLRLLDKSEASITILMGDFNEWARWAQPLRWLRRRFGTQPAPATFPGRRPLLALDRIWVRPGRRLVSLGAMRSPTARIASDHLPLVAEVDVASPYRWTASSSRTGGRHPGEGS